ncbi:MAG TPA: ATP-binding cassette domain-containing protein [Nitrososphaerales archaeon]|nr:ATP-binding cassette domain-containing protein [Nitrososphaerales archaeon]
MPSIIQAENLSKLYPPKTKAVDNVSFSVEEGEVFGFLGPNGAGKTTTIKMLTTLASITSGKASVAGFDVSRDPSAVRRSIGVVPQELTADDELKGIENLILAARLHHVPRSEVPGRAKDLLKLFDLEEASERRVRTYSGGMRRRLQMAMGLVHSPKVLFLDEPTLGLDIQTRTKVWDYINRLNKEHGLTVFMTTHYLEEADGLCNRIAIIDHGVIKVSDSPKDLKEKFGGDVLSISVSGDTDLTEFLRTVPDVTDVSHEGLVYKMKLPKTEQALPVIIEGVTKRGLKITEISFTRPKLDDVFLEVTGRSMREDEGGGEDSWVQNMNLGRTN